MRRIGRGAAVLIVGAGGLLVLGSALPAWARAQAPSVSGEVAVAVSGIDAVPAVPSAGVVALVAALVIGLSGRVARVVGSVAVAIAQVLAVVATTGFLRDPMPSLSSAAAEETMATGVTQAQTTGFPAVSIICCVAVAIVCLALPAVMGRWQRVGRRFERGTQPAEPSAPRSERIRAMDDWDAISRGEDPSG